VGAGSSGIILNARGAIGHPGPVGTSLVGRIVGLIGK
jgi:hypothetical protein